MPRLTIGRQALYELVWSKPTTIVAREFEVSDVAVIKVCGKLNVPESGSMTVTDGGLGTSRVV